MFLSEWKHLLMFNLQLCLTFERVSVMFKFPLHSAIVTIVQKSRVYGYKALSLAKMNSSFARANAVFTVFLKYYLSCLAVYHLLNVQNNSVKCKQASLKITDF